MLTRDMLTGSEALKNYSVAVVGLGVSNIPVIRFLNNYGAKITACDRKEREQLSSSIIQLEKQGVEVISGSNYLDVLYDRRFDLIVRSPGIRPDIKQFVYAVSNGATLTSEIELVFELCKAPIIGVTGSDGKTTSTTLVALMLEHSGYSVHLGGNIGTPLIEEVLDYQENDRVVLELSSFQLMTMKKSPQYALITNLSPNHLDYHKSYQEYVDAKSNIYLWQKNNHALVLNLDNAETSLIAKLVSQRVKMFSRLKTVSEGACLIESELTLIENSCKYPICKQNEVKLVGLHNIENILGAASLAFSAGATLESIRKVAISFTGVEHRIEYVKELNGITFYNDSIASSPTRAIAGLNSFTDNIVLIAGGSDKYVPFDNFGEVVANRVKSLVLLGKTTDKIYTSTVNALKKQSKEMTIKKTQSLEEAVKTAYNLAESGDVVLLSPACASFDMFKNFVERGNLFKQYVQSL